MPTPKTPIPDDFEERYTKAKLENRTDRDIAPNVFGISYCLLGRWKKEREFKLKRTRVTRPKSVYDKISKKLSIPVPNDFVERYIEAREKYDDRQIADKIFFVSWGVLRKWKLQHNITLVRAKKGRNVYNVTNIRNKNCK